MISAIKGVHVLGIRSKTTVSRRVLEQADRLMAVAAFWGFGESFAGAPHMQTWLIVPLFWGLYGVVSPFIRSSR